ncbi:MAG: LexA family transcriptional regulator [Caulobacteraceae bacterium]
MHTAIGFRKSAEVARAVGIASTTMDGYLRGAMPSADRAFTIADELGVDAKWLVTGEGVQDPGGDYLSEGDLAPLPRYDIFTFESAAPPRAIELVPIRRDWLMMVARTVSGLWLTEMPSDAMTAIAPAGGTIICKAPDASLAERRVYAFLLDGRPIIRRVQLQPNALVLEADNPSIDPIRLGEESGENLIPIGRVVAAINLQAV